MGCKCAPACKKALDDATKQWPDRSRVSDGCCGDERHRKTKSDHNPDASGFAHAFDLTHDPAHGVDCNILSLEVIDDPRVTYVIWMNRIYNRARATEGWRVYKGKNPHNKHMHVSIKPEARNNLAPWPWSPEQGEKTDTSGPPPYPGKPLQATEAIKLFQRFKGLTSDGIIGPATWKELFK